MTTTSSTNTNTSNVEIREQIHSMIIHVFLAIYFCSAVYYLHRGGTQVVRIKKTCVYLNELFWKVNDVMEICAGIEYEDDVNDNDNDKLITIEDIVAKKVDIKYEDKYLNELEKLNHDFQFTWDMVRQRDERIADLLKGIRIKIENEMKILTHTLNNSLDDQEREEEILERLTVLEFTLHNPNVEEMKQEANQYVKNTYLDGLVNNFIMEKTPSGNVIMYYNNKRGSFEFYSDNTIPYRYLETVSRKYVKTFNCRYLYVDMENELNESDKLIKEQNDKKCLAKDVVQEETNKKKDVFAKFKGYNKESGTGRVNTAVAPKNSVPNNVKNRLAEDDAVVRLKMNANRYTCEGRLSNFNFLKVPDRKVVDKKYAMTFADFKKKSSTTTTTTTLLI
jgi:hypothetical protein